MMLEGQTFKVSYWLSWERKFNKTSDSSTHEPLFYDGLLRIVILLLRQHCPALVETKLNRSYCCYLPCSTSDGAGTDLAHAQGYSFIPFQFGRGA